MKAAKAQAIAAEEFDKKFDAGGSVSGHLDLSSVRRPVLEQKRVNVDFPVWMIDSLDKEARRVGVARQALIKLWIAERLEKTRAKGREKRSAG